MRCQRTERERLTFGKASLTRASLHASLHTLTVCKASLFAQSYCALLCVAPYLRIRHMEVPYVAFLRDSG